MVRYFTELNDGYVQVGEHVLTERWKRGYNSLQQSTIVGQTTGGSEVLPNDWTYDHNALNSFNLGYNTAAYGIGVSTESTSVSIPKVRRMKFFYFYQDDSETLVQCDYNEWISDAPLQAKLAKTYRSNADFYADFPVVGRTNQVKYIPRPFTESTINELSSFVGDFVLENNNVVNNVSLYVNHLWRDSMRPTLSEVYMLGYNSNSVVNSEQSTDTVKNRGLEGIPAMLLRLRGDPSSKFRAPINSQGSAIIIGNEYDANGNRVLVSPYVTINGVTTTGQSAYNVNSTPTL